MSTAGTTTGELPAGEDGWPSAEQTPPMPSWCGGVSEAAYTMEGETGFERQLCSVDVGPEWCQVAVHQAETWDRSQVRRTDPTVQIWTSSNFTDRFTLTEAQALGAALLAAADRLEAAQLEHEATVEAI